MENKNDVYFHTFRVFKRLYLTIVSAEKLGAFLLKWSFVFGSRHFYALCGEKETVMPLLVI